MHALLEVRGLTKYYWPQGRRADVVRAVDGVSFEVMAGTTMAIVGESGSGKSTTGRALLRLIEPTAGQVVFDGVNLLALDKTQLRQFRSRIQIVFQDTYASLDPRWTVGRLLTEPLVLHTDFARPEIRRRVIDMLKTVGLNEEHAQRFPHELSGGQSQRIGIARALMLHPQLLVCDEPVSALDVSVQAQVLNLMKDLQQQFGLTYVFISHDLSVVEFMADDIVVMSKGVAVEQGASDQVLNAPKHPYTKALIASVPVPDPGAYEDRNMRRRLIREGLRASAVVVE